MPPTNWQVSIRLAQQKFADKNLTSAKSGFLRVLRFPPPIKLTATI